MDQPSSGGTPITAKQRVWLEKQLTDWQTGNIVSPDQVRAILARYESAQSTQSRLTQMLFTALTALAVIMCAAGVLLLIGYNWAAIPRTIKVALIFSTVALTFIASTVAYARQRPIAGEILALLGTLFYGCAIWLLAQVFHIESHYPDGVMWWMIGALGTAWLVQSTIIGVEAIILSAIWVIMESAGFSHPNYLYWVFAAAILGLAHVRLSAWLLALWIIATTIWFISAGVSAWRPENLTVVGLTLFGCACYATSLWPSEHKSVPKIWRFFGLAILLIPLLLLTFKGMHRDYYETVPWANFRGEWVVLGLLVAWVLVSIRRLKGAGFRADWPIIVITLATAYAGLAMIVPELGVSWRGTLGHGESMLLLFSGVTIIFALWLMIRGIRLDRGVSFFTGIIYLLAFVLVRWIDLIGDMISSAILFFISGAILFAAAWFWRQRKNILKSNASVEASHD